MLIALTESQLLFTVLGTYLTLGCLWLAYWVFERLANRSGLDRVDELAREMSIEAEVQPFVAVPSEPVMQSIELVRQAKLNDLRRQLSTANDKVGDYETRMRTLQSEVEALRRVVANNAEADSPTAVEAEPTDVTILSFYQPQLEKYDADWSTIDPELGVIIARHPADADDLTRIWGVGEVYQTQLNEFGVYYFQQLADWTVHNVDKFNELLSFKGRIEREEWVAQAKRLIDKESKREAA